jgi:hypothetical protein
MSGNASERALRGAECGTYHTSASQKCWYRSHPQSSRRWPKHILRIAPPNHQSTNSEQRKKGEATDRHGHKRTVDIGTTAHTRTTEATRASRYQHQTNVMFDETPRKEAKQWQRRAVNIPHEREPAVLVQITAGLVEQPPLLVAHSALNQTTAAVRQKKSVCTHSSTQTYR